MAAHGRIRERLTYARGEPGRWRVINLTGQFHPMHLHGFYFEVESLGDGAREESVRARSAATGRHPGDAAGLDGWGWRGGRSAAGNWLFHCHMMAHVSAELRLGARRRRQHATVITAVTMPLPG